VAISDRSALSVVFYLIRESPGHFIKRVSADADGPARRTASRPVANRAVAYVHSWTLPSAINRRRSSVDTAECSQHLATDHSAVYAQKRRRRFDATKLNEQEKRSSDARKDSRVQVSKLN